MKILLTGFDPFGEKDINPSWEVVKTLPDEISGHKIIKKQVPTVFGSSFRVLREYINEYSPDVLLMVGQAGGRSSVSVERVAINIDDAPIEDNEGNQPIDERIAADGDNAYFSNLPVKAMVKRMNDSGIPATLSNSAGTFVCNHLFYSLLHFISKTSLSLRAGFIHVPFFPSQVCGSGDLPSMAADTVLKGICCAIEAVIQFEDDLKIFYGREY